MHSNRLHNQKKDILFKERKKKKKKRERHKTKKKTSLLILMWERVRPCYIIFESE